MARKLDIEPAPLERGLFFVGCDLYTTEEALFTDAPKLARDFAARKNAVEGRVMPVVTAVVAGEPDPAREGRLRYFMGDQVEKLPKKLPEGFSTFEVPAGTVAARVPVRFRTEAGAAMAAAKVRRAFCEQWLPGSGYESAAAELGFSDVELYHYRRRRFRRARKMVLELLFPLRPVAGE